MARQGISIREAARRLTAEGYPVTDIAVGKWIKKGLMKTLPDGSLDPEMLEAQVAFVQQRQSPIHGGKRVKGQIGSGQAVSASEIGGILPPGKRVTFEEVRIATETRRGLLQDLDIAERRRDLVSRQKVERALTDLGALARAVLERIPDKLASTLAAETDPHRVWEILTVSLDEAMEEIADRSTKIERDMAA